MSTPTEPTPAEKLRRHVARLEEENRRLRGQRVPSAAAVDLQRENADLRRRLAVETPRSTAAGGEPCLTVPQVAQALGLSTYEVLRDLRDSLPMRIDDDGNTVVAKKDLDTFLLARAQGRPTQRFL